MSLTSPPPELAARLESAVSFARLAGASTLPLFAQWQDRVALRLETKADGTPVTQADRGAESLLRDLIAESFPHDGVLGEEWGERCGSSGYRWVLDPIDGTASFIRGVPLYGTMVGLEYQGITVAGAIECPAIGERVWGARGIGAFHQVGSGATRPARVSRLASIADACVSTTSPQYFATGGCSEAFRKLEQAFGTVRGWSDCYGFVLLATGRIEAVIEPNVKIWDLCAAQGIIEAAGGRFTDLAGVDGCSNGSCIATNGAIHIQVLAAISDP